MSATAIENALKAYLASYPLPKAWPNQDFDPTAPGKLPYIACDLVRAATIDDTLNAERPIAIGRLIVTIVVARGTSTASANGHADAVAAMFPMGARIQADTQVITITQPPHVREGMPDNGYWRATVSIPYLAE